MFESIINFFKNLMKKENKTKDTARERLQLVLMQDRASVSADYLDLMKQEIIEVIKKYINIDENALQVELTKPKNKDGTFGAPSLYANIPILSIKTEHKPKEVITTTDEANDSEKKEDEVPEKGNENLDNNKDNIEQNNIQEVKPEFEKDTKIQTKEKEKVEKKDTISKDNNKQKNNLNNVTNKSNNKSNNKKTDNKKSSNN